MQTTKITYLLKNIFLILLGFLFIFLLYFTHLMASVLVPVFFAFFTAMFLYPFIHKLHKTQVPNWLSTLIVYLIFILIVSIFLSILGISFGNFVSDLPEITREFREKLEDLIVKISKMELIKKYIYQDQITEMLLNISTTVLSIENFKMYVIKPVGVTLDILKAFGLYSLALIFIIPGMSTLSKKIFSAFPDKNGSKINIIIINITEQIQSYIVSKSIISFATGVISFIICIIFQVKYALLWGVVIFLFNYIPIIGSIIAIIFPILLSIIQYQSMIHFSLLATLLVSIQIIMGNIIEPKFMSKGVNLSPLVIFTSLLIWAYIWGIAGVILSVPIMSAFNLICGNIESLKPINILISARKKIKKNK